MSSIWRVVVVLLLVACISKPSTGQVPHSSHVWIVTEENHSYENVVTSMPYLMSLANHYGLATQYYADMHNSLSTLMHLAAGQTITLNDSTKATFNANNLVRQMLPAGLTFRLYQEELPYAGYQGISYNEYVKRHNPLVYFTDVANSSLVYNNVPYSRLAYDLSNGSTGNLNYVTPDLLDDAHDGTMQAADYWLSQHIPAILARPEFQAGGDGLMFIVFDEGNLSSDNRCSATISTGCGGRVATVVIGPKVRSGFRSSVWYDHESLLKTVCLALGTPSCPGFAKNARPMLDFFGYMPATQTEPMNIVLTFPLAGAYTSNPMRMAGCATSSHPITGWSVYVDGASVWHTSSWLQCVSTTFSAGLGTHTVVVRAWDSSGAYRSQTQSVTVPIVASMSSPYQNETVGPYVQVIASASALDSVSGWTIYVDNVAVWHTGATSSINQWISVGAGTHTLTVSASDASGYTASRRATVYRP